MKVDELVAKMQKNSEDCLQNARWHRRVMGAEDMRAWLIRAEIWAQAAALVYQATMEETPTI